MSQLKLSELIGSLSHALDLTDGQPPGHCVRSCWIGMHVGRRIGMDEESLWSLYYTLLLKDLGCSSNAARICELYMSDDRSFKRDFKRVGASTPALVAFVLGHTGPHASWRKRLGALINIARNADEIAHDLIQTRCSRGADIARKLRFPEPVALGVHCLDEHFDGSGQPEGLVGETIPLGSRIALLAQVVDVFHVTGGAGAAMDEMRRRSGTWFDPALVDAMDAVALDPEFWRVLGNPQVETAVRLLEPQGHSIELDEEYLDEIAAAFGEVVDAKSPFTAGHSERVGHYTDLVAAELGLPAPRRRWLRRAALLHDVGKLGVSNTILDKPGRLDADEWVAVKQHAMFTEQILGRISQFAELAKVSGAHHERLDGTGYPRGLSAPDIAMETRIITVADIFDAITAERPYHPPMEVDRALEIMRASVGSAIDGDCFVALERIAVAEACATPKSVALAARPKQVRGRDSVRAGALDRADGRRIERPTENSLGSVACDWAGNRGRPLLGPRAG